MKREAPGSENADGGFAPAKKCNSSARAFAKAPFGVEKLILGLKIIKNHIMIKNVSFNKEKGCF